MNWKAVVRKALHRKGYQVYKVGAPGEYTLCPPYSYTTYSPWFEDWFQEIYGKIKHRTVVTEDRCYVIYKLCHHCLHLKGDFAECGVYKGGTAYLIAYALKKNPAQGKRLHLFDTFAGMPIAANEDKSRHKKGDFGDVSLSAVKDYLRKFGNCDFHSGFIPETFQEVREKQFALVHIDVDLYQTAKDCCSFFYHRMVRGGVMIFDDYGFPRYRLAERRAVDEFFSDKPEEPISLHTGQCVVLKL